MELKPQVTVNIRPYGSADQTRVRWLFERTPPWGRTYPAPQPLPDELETPDKTFGQGCWVALEHDIAGEAVVGFCAVSLVPGEGEDQLPEFFDAQRRWGRVRWLSVAPERWRLGIGRRLVEQSMLYLNGLGCDGVVLDTTSTQEGAIALYTSMGFVERGRTSLGVWTLVWMEHLPR